MRNIPFIFIFLLINFSCQKYNQEQQTIIYDDYYENQEAADLNEQGILYSQKGDVEKAKEYFLKSLELEPNNPTTMGNLGLNRYLAYDYEEAIEYLQKSYILSDSTYHQAGVNLGIVYYYSQEFEKGVKISDYVINNASDNTILSGARTHRALNNIKLNECKKALMDLDFIKNNYNKVENIDFHIKDLQEKLKDCPLK